MQAEKLSEKSQAQTLTDSASLSLAVAKKKCEPIVSKYDIGDIGDISEIDNFKPPKKVDYLSDLIESGLKGPSNDLAVYREL